MMNEQKIAIQNFQMNSHPADWSVKQQYNKNYFQYQDGKNKEQFKQTVILNWNFVCHDSLVMH